MGKMKEFGLDIDRLAEEYALKTYHLENSPEYLTGGYDSVIDTLNKKNDISRALELETARRAFTEFAINIFKSVRGKS